MSELLCAEALRRKEMRVLIEENGHQSYRKIEGEVVLWTTTVEYFDGKPMPVPCVLVNDGESVIAWPLKRQLYSSKVTVIGA